MAMNTKKGQPSQPIYEDFHPSTEWMQDAVNHVLRVYLPDFNKEDIRVQVDGLGKLTVRGRKLESIGQYKRVEEFYQVPNDCILEKISGKFEDGCLTLIMPKKVVEKEGAEKMISSMDAKEERTKAETSQSKEPADEKKEVKEKEEPRKTHPSEAKSKEGEIKAVPPKTLPSDEKKEAKEKEEPQKTHPSEEKSKEGEIKAVPPKTLPSDEKKEAKEKEEPQKTHPSEEKSKEGEIKAVPPKTLPSDEKKEVEKIEEPQMMLSSNEKNEEEVKKEVARKVPRSSDDKKQEEPYQKEQKFCKDDEYKGKAKINKRVSWNKKEDEGRSGCQLLNNLLEKINDNKRVIIVGLAAFSIGLYVSHKLKSSGN